MKGSYFVREIDNRAINAAKDDAILSDFVKEQKQFIISCAYKTTKKYLTINDDEWSIALIAFSDAVKKYDLSKGAFLSYAETMIDWRLIDYLKSENKKCSEFSVNPSVFDGEQNDNDENINIKIEVTKKISCSQNYSIKDEIEAANAEFKKFGFSFYDLSKSSPKFSKNKSACKQAVNYILENEEIKQEIYRTKQLPIKIIQKNTDLPRKLLEHHRKYIIAAIEILSGEYPYLAEYVSFIRKGDR